MNKKLFFILILFPLILIGCNGVKEEVQDIKSEAEELADETIDQTNKILDKTQVQMNQITEDISQSITDANQAIDEQVVTENEIAEVRIDALVALTEDSYEEVYNFIEINETGDTTEIEELINSNEVVLIDDATMVKVLDIELDKAQVQILGTDFTGYIHVSLLSQIS